METRRDSSFYVVRLPLSVFETDPEVSIRPEFESVFRSYGEEVSFMYLKSFGRVRVIYPDPEQCSTAWANLRGKEFHGSTLQLRRITVSHRMHLTPSLPLTLSH
ncbi:Calcipressin-1 [Geodia barretti]|uniref:Calcipressin-1 n=1 Tax=Geodia barretti TaxID=519541 RepID=A0AA35QZX3_GEOBA|nr:Calcipressin-1 [Geodia barretti]